MRFELNDALNILYAVAIIIVTRYLVPFLREKLAQAGQESLIELINQLVQGAEKIYKEPKSGQTKKAYVVRELAAQGITVDEKTNAMIEAAVGRLPEEAGNHE